MPFQVGSNSSTFSASELLLGMFEDLQAGFKQVKYGKLQWRDVVPQGSVNGAINPGATSVSYPVEDWRGKGDWRSPLDQSLPTVTYSLNKVLIPIQVGGVEAVFDREDARQVNFGLDFSLLDKLPSIMRMACERHVEETVFYGDNNVNFRGFLGYTGVPVSSSPDIGRLNGAAQGTAEARQLRNMTPEQIIFVFNNAIQTVWTTSRFEHLPDTFFVDGDTMGLLASTLISTAGNQSVLSYLKRNNIYTAQTGRELNFIAIRYLSNAGSNDTKRMVCCEFDSDNVMLPFPIPFDLLTPQEWKMGVYLPAEYKFGSYHIPYPRAYSYIDGV